MDSMLQRIVQILDEAGIPYMLTGSLASSYHGVPRSTADIDLVIAPKPGQIERLAELLPRDAYYLDEKTALEATRSRGQFNIIDFATGWKADLIILKARPFNRTEFERRKAAVVEDVNMVIATAEDVLIAKLEWAKLGESLRQVEDAAGILHVRGAELDFAYIAQWVDQLDLHVVYQSAQARAMLP
jgi:hypothetical protein